MNKQKCKSLATKVLKEQGHKILQKDMMILESIKEGLFSSVAFYNMRDTLVYTCILFKDGDVDLIVKELNNETTKEIEQIISTF